MALSKRWLAILGSTILVFLLSTLMDFPAQTISAIGDALVIQDPPARVDVIHVIAGDDYRTQYAIQLYQQGYARLLFFTGGWCTRHGYYHGAHARELALQAGVPPQAVAYDDSQVSSTYDEVLLLQKYLAASHPTFQAVMVVSDPFHMRRARWTYRQILGRGFSILMAPVPFSQTPFKQQWWADRPSANYVMDEYKKMVFYFFRYQLNFTWLASLDKNN